MISNRESARRSRMKREQHIKDLNDQVTYYTTKRSSIVQKIDKIEEHYAATESENRILRMQVEELNERLESLEKLLVSYNSTSDYVTDAMRSDGGCSVIKDILEEPLPKPWLQPPYRPSGVDGIYQFF